MRISTFATLAVTLYASLAAAGMVLTPVFEDQAVEKLAGDCPYGVVTPMGCGPGRKNPTVNGARA
ncbi:uncharacterized protein DNG_02637 [Cephalotrichum gorgonifer]|uniref:Uncharacterized protein n=1 Tax=Cephalotrichum gorgonifer TaxID=2041049 RepID=A0AAE8MVF2_9PEZI|nr:uncharacterized protein DNG_02637 [Cephalotrichum gorgonifer]